MTKAEFEKKEEEVLKEIRKGITTSFPEIQIEEILTNNSIEKRKLILQLRAEKPIK